MADYQEEGVEPPPYLYEDAARIHPENDDWAEEEVCIDIACCRCQIVFSEGFTPVVGSPEIYCSIHCIREAGYHGPIYPVITELGEND